jgi:cell division protein FtsA
LLRLKKYLGLPIRIGIPDKATGLVDEVLDPQFASTIGLIFYGTHNTTSEQSGGKDFNRILKNFSVNSSIGKLKSIFKQFIP